MTKEQVFEILRVIVLRVFGPGVTPRVKGLVEQFLRSAPITGEEETPSFVERWAGKFSVAKSAPRDLRMKALRARYHLKTR